MLVDGPVLAAFRSFADSRPGCRDERDASCGLGGTFSQGGVLQDGDGQESSSELSSTLNPLCWRKHGDWLALQAFPLCLSAVQMKELLWCCQGITLNPYCASMLETPEFTLLWQRSMVEAPDSGVCKPWLAYWSGCGGSALECISPGPGLVEACSCPNPNSTVPKSWLNCGACCAAVRLTLRCARCGSLGSGTQLGYRSRPVLTRNVM